MNAAATQSITGTSDTAVESILNVAWELPLWLIVVVALGLGGTVLWLYLFERGKAGRQVRWILAALRFALLMLVLWMMLGWSWQRYKSDQPELIIVVDRSASMSTRDTGDVQEIAPLSRFERAVELFESRTRRERQKLSRQYVLQWFSLAESLDQITLDFQSDAKLFADLVPQGTQSRLGEGLVRLLQRQAGKGTAAVIFLSDGINTSGPTLSEAAKAARRAAIPMLVVAVGRQTEIPDLRLADLLIDRDVYLGDQITAQVSVIANDIPSAETRIVVRDRATDQILDETRVSLSGQQRQVTARLSFAPTRAGELALRIEASAIAGEKELENNRIDEIVRVQDKTIRVLLVSGQPSYEFRFLKNFLERATAAEPTASSSFELYSVLQDADPQYVAQDKTALRLVPSRSEAIADIDAFVLIDFDPQLISQTSQQGIVDAVMRRGAGCIFISGAGSQADKLAGWPLAKLLPIERGSQDFPSQIAPTLGELHWQPTPLGSTALPMQLANSPQESMSLWQRFPEFSALSRVAQVKSGAQVLAQAVDRFSQYETPLLITQFAGAGRTALQASDESYRWTSFMGSDLYYQRYWGQMLRWLSRGKLSGRGDRIELSVDPKQAEFGQPIRFQVTLGSQQLPSDGDAEVELAIDGGNGYHQTLQLARVSEAAHVYQATTSDLTPGVYRGLLLRPLTDTPPSQEFSVSTPPGEQASLRTNIEGLKKLAEQSRGKLYLEGEAEQMWSEIPAGKPTRLGPLPSIPIWNTWWVALLFVSLITVEWILRRRFRML